MWDLEAARNCLVPLALHITRTRASQSRDAVQIRQNHSLRCEICILSPLVWLHWIHWLLHLRRVHLLTFRRIVQLVPSCDVGDLPSVPRRERLRWRLLSRLHMHVW